LDEIQTKVLRVFLLAIQSHLYSFASKFVFIQTHTTSYSFYSAFLYTVKEKAGKPDRDPYHLPYGLIKSIQKPQVWELSRLCPKTSKKSYVHEFGFRELLPVEITWRTGPCDSNTTTEAIHNTHHRPSSPLLQLGTAGRLVGSVLYSFPPLCSRQLFSRREMRSIGYKLRNWMRRANQKTRIWNFKELRRGATNSGSLEVALSFCP
jgi:hypothetical protein